MKKIILVLCAAVAFVCGSCQSKRTPVVGVWEANVTMQSELDSTTKIVPAATLLTKQHIIWTFLDDETFTWFVEQRVIGVSFTEPFENESESKEAFIKQFTKTLSFSGSYHQFRQTCMSPWKKRRKKPMPATSILSRRATLKNAIFRMKFWKIPWFWTISPIGA